MTTRDSNHLADGYAILEDDGLTPIAITSDNYERLYPDWTTPDRIHFWVVIAIVWLSGIGLGLVIR